MIEETSVVWMADYLKGIEEEEGFIPWDDEDHARQNLLTKFHCSSEEAYEAVRLANVSTLVKL